MIGLLIRQLIDNVVSLFKKLTCSLTCCSSQVEVKVTEPVKKPVYRYHSPL